MDNRVDDEDELTFCEVACNFAEVCIYAQLLMSFTV